ncbi:MAG: hypothetical protein WCD89_11540 [Anaerocolumna sp.]
MSTLDNWELAAQYDGSTHFENFTYSVIAAILVNIVTDGIGTVASAVVGTIAGTIVSEQIPTVYYHKMVFYYREGPALVTQVQVLTTFYYDADHETYLDATTETFDGMFPW